MTSTAATFVEPNAVLPNRCRCRIPKCAQCGFANLIEMVVGDRFGTGLHLKPAFVAGLMFEPVGADRKIPEARRENMFVQGIWSDVRHHVAAWLVRTHPNGADGQPLHTRIYDMINDGRLIERFFEPRAAYKGEISESFIDAIVKPTILVLRLGTVLKAHDALPNAIYTTLRQRETMPNRLTLVVSDSFVPWRKGHPAWDGALAEYLGTFRQVTIPSPKKDQS